MAPGPLLIWMILQLGAIALAAWRVPLAAQYPQPGEFQAVHILIVVQFVGAALLSPLLLTHWRTSLATLFSGGTLLLVACALAARSLQDTVPILGYLALWLLCLFAWMKALGGEKWKMAGAATAAAFTAGGPILWYLGLDLSAAGGEQNTFLYGPLWPALLDPSVSWKNAGTLTFLCFLAILITLVRAQVFRQTRP